jgi:hypothetical protein
MAVFRKILDRTGIKQDSDVDLGSAAMSFGDRSQGELRAWAANPAPPGTRSATMAFPIASSR